MRNKWLWMIYSFLSYYVFAGSVILGSDLTAITLFECDEQGTVLAGRWNSGPKDDAWDVFLYEGRRSNPQTDKIETIPWVSGKDSHLIDYPLTIGVHTFKFHFESHTAFPRFGCNLFFDDNYQKPGISVMTLLQTQPGAEQKYQEKHSMRTMGWPLSEVPAAGCLCYEDSDTAAGTDTNGTTGIRYSLKDFRIYSPTVSGELDLVGPHQIEPSGNPDYAGEFTLVVEKFTYSPADWMPWLHKVIEADSVELPQIIRQIEPPFSFHYAGQPARELLGQWEFKSSSEKLDKDCTVYHLTWKDSRTSMLVRWEGLLYHDFPTVEWTLYFKNEGDQDSPILSDIKTLDLSLQGDEGEFRLHHQHGDGVADPFKPIVSVLEENQNLHFAPYKGRSSEGVWPYFAVESPGNSVLLAVGWPGQWNADFMKMERNLLHFQAGQELTHFKLLPGEEVRSPRIVLQFSKVQNWIDAQNLWRRWMLAHNMPRTGGQLPAPILAGSSAWQYGEMVGANEENQKMFIDRYLEAGIQLDYWWMDAGWFVFTYNCVHADRWEADQIRFPNGMRAITDYAHARGIKCILWFIPEQVPPGSWLWENHTDWLLGPDPPASEVVDASNVEANSKLLYLGNPQAWQWAVDRFDQLIQEENIDIYRNDLGMQQRLRILDYWKLNDTEDRQGITEIKHMTAFLAYYDELRKRNPNLLIDNCAAGGKRNDVETLRRAIVLWRTDAWHPSTMAQCYTYGLAFWLPFFGSAVPSRPDPYTFRSNMLPGTCLTLDMRNPDEEVVAITRRLVEQREQVVPNFFGDFYPLTKYSTDEDTWIAWQFNRPIEGQGMIQAFRREQSYCESARFKIRALEPQAHYRLANIDEPGVLEMTGKQLMEEGLAIVINEQPGAVITTYHRLP